MFHPYIHSFPIANRMVINTAGVITPSIGALERLLIFIDCHSYWCCQSFATLSSSALFESTFSYIFSHTEPSNAQTLPKTFVYKFPSLLNLCSTWHVAITVFDYNSSRILHLRAGTVELMWKWPVPYSMFISIISWKPAEMFIVILKPNAPDIPVPF
jgi:hypothetical protein